MFYRPFYTNIYTKCVKTIQTSIKKEQHSSHEFIPVKFGSKERKLALQPDTSKKLNAKETTYVQSVVSSLLYREVFWCVYISSFEYYSFQQNSPIE